MAERRINLRFDPETFRQLSVKSAETDISFQELGVGWFLEWLHGGKGAPKVEPFPDLTEKERKTLRGLLDFLRDDSEDLLVRANKKMLEGLANARRR